jgi:hypothetical protein
MKRPLCNGCKKKPKTIDNDVKEKYKTIPPQTRVEKGIELFFERNCKMARFPRTEPEIVALAQAMVS